MGNCFRKKEFSWSEDDEPHSIRRKEILAYHPEIKNLFGPDLRLLPCVIFMISAQFGLAYITQYVSWYLYFLSAFVIGGTISHSMSLAIHELSHGLCFEDEFANELLGMFANCAQGIPSMITFKRYHMEHHQKQGMDMFDVDVPTYLEGYIFQHALGKIIFIMLQPLLYSIRPLIIYPKTTTWKEIMNWTIVMTSNVAIYLYSPSCLLYLLLSDLLGMGLHPTSGHLISEHFESHPNQETYSYYGKMNNITFNVGYHNEHHDFTRISGFHLPKVKVIAPEYYDTLYSHDSWTMVLYNFIMDPNMSPFSRIKRVTK
jgi:sphingolipid delta-4 desaturase